MYACSACGGNLKYDIASQMLKCTYCGQEYEPDMVFKESDGEGDSFDCNVFRCPQCGGEIYSLEDTAAGFCSYCGASTILQSRLERGKKVEYIIPFHITKEDCKDVYLKLMNRAIYAPSALKKREFVDEFRGIYMPYWIYDMTQIGKTSLKGEKSYRRGDYIVTDHYQVDMDLYMDYSGLNFDGASGFADDISERLAPFQLEDKLDFAPGYLCGYYADMPDVDEKVYRSSVREFADKETWKYINGHKELSGITLKKPNSGKVIPTQQGEVRSAMFPVWFLAYRNRDRVAYATVNGQTGRIAADIPVDIGKYLIGTAIFTLPIMLLLNMLLTMTPTTLLGIAALIAVLSGWLYSREMKQIVVKETNVSDKGLQYKRRKNVQKNHDGFSQKSSINKKEVASFFLKTACFLVICVQSIPLILSLLNTRITGIVLCAILFILNIYFASNSKKYAQMLPCIRFDYTAFLLVAVSALPVVLFLLKPANDLWYYGATIAMLFVMVFVLLDLMKNYNFLATRRLVQFEHTGGDDCA